MVVLGDAPPPGAHGSERMGLVDQHQCLVPPLHLDELGQIGEIPVHAVHALDGDQHAAVLVPVLPQKLVRRPPVVVCKRPSPGAGKQGSLENAVVVQGILQDQVAGPEQMANHAFVGGVPGHHRDGVFGAQQTRECGFQLAVELPFA